MKFDFLFPYKINMILVTFGVIQTVYSQNETKIIQIKANNVTPFYTTDIFNPDEWTNYKVDTSSKAQASMNIDCDDYEGFQVNYPLDEVYNYKMNTSQIIKSEMCFYVDVQYELVDLGRFYVTDVLNNHTIDSNDYFQPEIGPSDYFNNSEGFISQQFIPTKLPNNTTKYCVVETNTTSNITTFIQKYNKTTSANLTLSLMFYLLASHGCVERGVQGARFCDNNHCTDTPAELNLYLNISTFANSSKPQVEANNTDSKECMNPVPIYNSSKPVISQTNSSLKCKDPISGNSSQLGQHNLMIMIILIIIFVFIITLVFAAYVIYPSYNEVNEIRSQSRSSRISDFQDLFISSKEHYNDYKELDEKSKKKMKEEIQKFLKKLKKKSDKELNTIPEVTEKTTSLSGTISESDTTNNENTYFNQIN